MKNYSEQHRSRRLHTQTRDNSASQTEERGRGPELHHKQEQQVVVSAGNKDETGAEIPCKVCQAWSKVTDGGTKRRKGNHAKSKESSKSKEKLDLTTQQCRDPESLKTQSALQTPECSAAELAKLSGSKICSFSPQKPNKHNNKETFESFNKAIRF